MLIKLLLQNPLLWQLSQIIFGSNLQKQLLYSSLVKNKEKLLDFGCANGNTFPAFKDYDYTGIDIDCRAIEYASKKYSQYPNAKFICSDVLKNKFKKESYQSILFAGTAHHISDELLFKIINSLSRLLKKGGAIYFVDPIKDKKRDSKLLELLISLDQGKFHRDEKYYNSNFKKLSPILKLIYHKTYIIKGNLMPQPTYYIAKLKKVK